MMLLRLSHKGIQGKVWRSRKGVLTGTREREPPLSRLLVKNESNLLIRDDISIIWKDDIDFFHARRFEQ